MKQPLLTMSGIQRAMACPASCLLPRAKRNTKWSGLGTVVHGFLANCLTKGRDEALAEAPLEHKAACEAIDIASMPARDPGAYSPEVAVAYNIRTGEARVLETVKDREYPPLEDGWICGTSDVIGLTTEAVIILDYKTGFGDQTRAKKHAQVRTYGLAFARAYGREKAIVGVIRGFMDGGEPWFDLDTMDAIDLDDHAYQLETTLRRIEEAKAQMDAGAWDGSTCLGEYCTRCDAFPYCPAQQILARMVVRAGEGEIAPLTPGACGKLEEVGSHLNEANARGFMERVLQAKKTVDALEEILQTYARGAPIPLDDGFVYGPRPWPLEKIDPDLARAVIVHGLQEEDPQTKETTVWSKPYGEAVYTASVSTKVELKKGDLEDALKVWAKLNPGAKYSRELKAVVEALRRAGASRVTYSYPVGKHKPKADPNQKFEAPAATATA